MKKILFAVLAACMWLGGCKQKNNKEVIVAFYNCENFLDNKHNEGKEDEDFTPYGKYHYTDRIYQEKQDHIASVLAKMADDNNPDGPAIVGLAEVENSNVLNGLVNNAAIADRHYKYEWYDGTDLRGINVAMLYNPEHFSVLKSEPLHVTLPEDGGKHLTRDVLHVYGVLDGDTVHVFVNHWPSRRGEEASDQRRATAAMVDKHAIDDIMKADPKSKVIVMGDLNDNPDNVSVTDALGANGDKDKVAMTGLYNPWVAIYNPANRGTEVFENSWNLFDQIMVSGAFVKGNHKLRYERAEIFKPDFIVDHYKKYEGQPHRSWAGARWIHGYSDHFPVMVYLSE